METKFALGVLGAALEGNRILGDDRLALERIISALAEQEREVERRGALLRRFINLFGGQDKSSYAPIKPCRHWRAIQSLQREGLSLAEAVLALVEFVLASHHDCPVEEGCSLSSSLRPCSCGKCSRCQALAKAAVRLGGREGTDA